MQIAGLLATDPQDGGGEIAVLGKPPSDWEETAFREVVTMVPQRSALLRGTVRENLALAADATDDEMWAALAAADLQHTFARAVGWIHNSARAAPVSPAGKPGDYASRAPC
nr:hypothetical protein [Methyloceanibacter stevinii]